MFPCFTGAKRPRIDSNFRKKFEGEVSLLSEWFDKTAINLELLTSEPTDPQDQLTLEEQLVLVKVCPRDYRLFTH